MSNRRKIRENISINYYFEILIPAFATLSLNIFVKKEITRYEKTMIIKVYQLLRGLLSFNLCVAFER